MLGAVEESNVLCFASLRLQLQRFSRPADGICKKKGVTWETVLILADNVMNRTRIEESDIRWELVTTKKEW